MYFDGICIRNLGNFASLRVRFVKQIAFTNERNVGGVRYKTNVTLGGITSAMTFRATTKVEEDVEVTTGLTLKDTTSEASKQ